MVPSGNYSSFLLLSGTYFHEPQLESQSGVKLKNKKQKLFHSQKPEGRVCVVEPEGVPAWVLHEQYP